MATFIASQATDMRVDLWRGIVVDSNADTIVATDGTHIARFDGAFSYPWSGYVGGGPVYPIAPWLGPYGLGPVSGTLTSYTQDIGYQPQFTIDMMYAAAGPIFHAVTYQDPDLATALLFAGFDTLVGSSGNDRLLGYGGGDNISGQDGNDRLSGSQGADFLSGGDGNDRLRGGVDSDTLRGDDGSDLLIGNAGPDQLTGGKNADTFCFLSTSNSPAGKGNRDTIRDFTHDLDLIDLERIDANTTEPGHQAFVFIGKSAFTYTAGQLRYANHTLSGDTEGDGHADFQVSLRHDPIVDAGDLLL